MDLLKQFLKFQKRFASVKAEYATRTANNVNDACKEMVQEAKAMTPPREGEDRGINTVTGNLASAWSSNYRFDGKDIEVTLSNDVQYASYVDQGHRMDKHFVPWLYIDAAGAIARHNPAPGDKLFGLVVGTATTYVKPYNMTVFAENRFFEAYYAMQSDTIEQMEKKLNGNND